MRASWRSLGQAMKRGETALIRSIRHSTEPASGCKRKVSVGGRERARRRARSETVGLLRACDRLGKPARGRFFLAIEKPGPYSETNVGVNEKFFRQAATRAARRRRSAVDDRIGERRATGLNALGRHLLVELFDCDPDVINDLEAVKGALIEAAKRAQATIVDVVFHEFNPFGISGVVVIAESHLSIHTWPEYRYAAVDVFSCGEVLQPEIAVNYLVEQFGAERASVVEMQRGVFVNACAPVANKTPVAVS